MDDAWGTPSTPISGNLQMTQRAILLGFCWGRLPIPTEVGYGYWKKQTHIIFIMVDLIPPSHLTMMKS